MTARSYLHGIRTSALVCILLVLPVSCDQGASPRDPATPLRDAAAPTTSAATTTPAAPDGVTPRRLRREPVPCPAKATHFVMHDIATVSQGQMVADSPPDVTVSSAGTATVAWSLRSGGIRTADDPPAPGDPQNPTHKASLFANFPEFNDYLSVDAADAQTLVYKEHVPGGGSNAVSDVVRADRARGAEWSSSPAAVLHRVRPDATQLAVNASGAAVVMWQKYPFPGRDEPVHISYRNSAGAGWTSPERVPVAQAFGAQVGIDDAGRVLVVYDRLFDGVFAVRRTPAGRWEKPQHLGGASTETFGMAVGAGGAAVVTYGVVYDAGVPIGPQFTSRMSPTGIWGPPVRQPEGPPFGLVSGAVDMDAKGRALIAGWHGTDLMGRWSRPNGRWRKPFVLAADVSKPRHFSLEVVVNRRGDALVVWGAKEGVDQLWVRYRLAGQPWTEPFKVTQADSPPRWLNASIGECGHSAVAWTTRNGRQIQVRRATPTP